MGGITGIVKGGLTPKMILDDVSFNFRTPIHSSPLTADESFVDQLLNFNNIDQFQPPQFQQQQQQQFNNTCNVVVVNSQQHVAEDKDKDPSFLSLPIHPAEEADLEWLSHFVDDSFSPYSTPFPPGYLPKPEPEPEPVKHEREPEKKRTRSGRRVRATSHSDSSPPPKNPVRKWSHKGEQKTCSHCGTQKTPQWRGGPKGPKTLCNACGVRFKKGRLLPEYRPASSPSYSRGLHSNSHRKVMEMRMVKNKEEAGP